LHLPACQPNKIRQASAVKKFSLLFLVAFIGFAPLVARADSKPAPAASQAKLPSGANQIASALSQITGVAISPLFGVGAVGCWDYCRAKTDAEKAKLNWYANPLFWFPALLLVLACVVKDTGGAMLPTAVKKPLDVAETVEHKISGLVACGAFVPIAASIFHSPEVQQTVTSALASAGFATVDLHWLYNFLIAPIAMVAFFIVFLASNAINILILISPFTSVDAALKGFRAAILASVTVTAFANPWIGAAWAVIIILISYVIAGWSLRLSHFGLVFVWDFISFRKRRFTPDAVANKLFLARKIKGVPSRTYGKLLRDGAGKLVLKYRPWLVLPERTLELPGEYCVGQGLFFSEILELDGDDTRSTILLPPRYRSHEEQLASIYRFTDVRPIGLRAAWAWLTGKDGKVKTVTA
jgi:MFS family permease